MLEFSLQRRRNSGSLYDKGVYPSDFTEEFKSYIRKRDKHRCAVCGKKRKPREQQLDVHHINFRKNTEKTNCISLCRDCHTILHKLPHYRGLWMYWLGLIACYREKKLVLSAEDKSRLVKQMRDQIKVKR